MKKRLMRRIRECLKQHIQDRLKAMRYKKERSLTSQDLPKELADVVQETLLSEDRRQIQKAHKGIR